MLAANESPSAADLVKAIEKVKAAHYSFGVQRIAQWTLNDIPPYAEEPYVAMAAYLMAPDFSADADPNWVAFATVELQRATNLPSNATVQTEYF